MIYVASAVSNNIQQQTTYNQILLLYIQRKFNYFKEPGGKTWLFVTYIKKMILILSTRT